MGWTGSDCDCFVGLSGQFRALARPAPVRRAASGWHAGQHGDTSGSRQRGGDGQRCSGSPAPRPTGGATRNTLLFLCGRRNRTARPAAVRAFRASSMIASTSTAASTMNGRMIVENRAARPMARAAWAMAALFASVPLLSIVYQPVGWGPRLCAGAVALVAASNPFNGLLVLAGLGPFAATILALTRTGSAPLNFAEALVLAFVLGTALRRAVLPRDINVPVPIGAATAVLALLSVASLIISAVVLHIERADMNAADQLRWLVVHNYLIGMKPLTSSMLCLESLALMFITSDACALDTGRAVRVQRMLVISATAAALLNLVR